MNKLYRVFYWLMGVVLLFASALQAGGVHYRVSASTNFYADADAKLAGIRINWVYDAEVSAFILDGRDTSTEGLQQVADDMVFDLNELGYFASFTMNSEPQVFAKASDYSIRLTDDQRLQLGVQLPLKQPKEISGQLLSLRLADPDGTADIIYSGIERVAVAEEFAGKCGKPDLHSDTLNINDHELTIQTVSIVCQ